MGQVLTKCFGSSNSSKPDLIAALPTFMQRQILAFFGFKDYAVASGCCTYIQTHWVQALEKNRVTFSVPIDCRTLKKAVTIAKTDRRIHTISVSSGEHQVEDDEGATILIVDFPINSLMDA